MLYGIIATAAGTFWRSTQLAIATGMISWSMAFVMTAVFGNLESLFKYIIPLPSLIGAGTKIVIINKLIYLGSTLFIGMIVKNLIERGFLLD